MPAATFTPTRTGAETIANSYLDDRQESAVVTPLTTGGYLVTWQSLNQPGDNGWGVFAQRFNADGSAVGGEIHVNTTLGDHQAGAAVLAQPGGAFTVVWTSFQGGTNNVMAQRFDASGAKLGGEFAIANSAELQEQGVNAVTLGDGSIVVSWSQYSATGRTEMAQHFDASWTALGSAFAISRTYTVGSGSAVHTQDPAALTALANGNVVSVWTQAETGDVYSDIWAEIVTASGSVVGGAFRVNTEQGQAQGQPSVATLTDGSFVVTYYSGYEGGTVFQRFAANGSKLGAEVRVDNTPNGSVTPSIAALADGGFVIAWQGGADGDGSAVSAQRFAADGSALGANFLLNGQTAAWQSQPHLAQLGNGTLVGAWSSEAYGHATDIAVQQYSLPALDNPVHISAGADHIIRVATSGAHVTDASFAGISGAIQLYNTGTGDLSYSFAANAEAAYSGGHVKARSGAGADSFTVDATGLSASATGDFFADHGVAHFTGGAERDTFYFVQATWGAAGRTADGGGGVNNVDLTFTGTVTDASFAGISHINELDLIGSSNATIQLGANAVAAFGSATVKVAALNSAVITVDGHALNAGYIGIGGTGADSFTGGAGNDSFYGKEGADLFLLGQGGRDRIYDFAEGTDHIDLSAAGIHSLAGLTMRANGTEAVLTFAGQELRLNNLDFHSLTASDFIFA